MTIKGRGPGEMLWRAASVAYTCSAANLELNGAVNNECDSQGAYLNHVPPTCEQSKCWVSNLIVNYFELLQTVR